MKIDFLLTNNNSNNNNTTMASASSSSAKHLFSDSKRRLADRITVNVNNTASVARQIVRGSKSNEVGLFYLFSQHSNPLIESLFIFSYRS